MSKVFLVGLGGFIGSALRYGMSGWVQDWTGRADFPIGTLVVNCLGCLTIGLLSQLMEARGLFSPDLRAFLFIGILGGFTTFSTFGNETINLSRDGATFLAIVNVAAHVILGLGAVWFGRVLAQAIWR